jgi:hypothetical protein
MGTLLVVFVSGLIVAFYALVAMFLWMVFQDLRSRRKR